MTRRGIELLSFGFLLTFLSSFGQTFFIGLFSDELKEAARLGDGAFGSLYSAATLASAACMFWAGGLIDRIALRSYVIGSTLLLTAGCLLVMTAADVLWLGLALFLLRFAGQGLFSHTAVTTTARLFPTARGKALVVTLLGHPAGEALLPVLVVSIAASAGWHLPWLLAAGLVLLATPLLTYLAARPAEQPVPGPPARSQAVASASATGTTAGIVNRGRDVTRREVMRDRRFHLLLPTLLLPGFVVTGVFIHQAKLVVEKGWTLSWFAVAFIVFAAAQVAGMLSSGPLIDRLTARRLVPFYLLPLGAACLVINVTDHRLIALPFMIGAGLTTGAAASIATALWAEWYGVTHLGAIRALAVATIVMSTALAPAIFGWLLEVDMRFDTVLLYCAAIAGAAMLMARTAVATGRH